MVRDVFKATEDMLMSTATSMMAEHRIRHLPVVDAENVPIGIFSDRDLFMFLASKTATGQKIHPLVTVNEMMTRSPVTVTEESPLQDAARIMDRKRIGCVLVVDSDRRLSGILTRGSALYYFSQLPTGAPSTEAADAN